MSNNEMSSVSEVFVITNAQGLHARPGAYLVKAINGFSSQIEITNISASKKKVNARSLLKLMTLGIKNGHSIRFDISGHDANETLQAIKMAFKNNFGE